MNKNDYDTSKYCLRNIAKARDWVQFHSPPNFSMALSPEAAEIIIKNTYRRLITRGQKGCCIYSTCSETSAGLKSFVKEAISETTNTTAQELTVKQSKAQTQQLATEKCLGLMLNILKPDDLKPFNVASVALIVSSRQMVT